MVFHLEIEGICLQQFLRLARRDPRYLGLVIPMYGRSVHSLVRSQMLRATYCFARFLDDVLDGDCAVSEDPGTYVRRVLQQAQSGFFSTETVASRLGRFIFQNVDRFAPAQDHPSKELIILIEAMLFDRKRACERLLLTQEELAAHHRRTFSSALNISLCIVGSYTRATSIPDVIQAQGCLYTIRDLCQDLSRALVNIPLDVVEEARRQGARDLSYDALRRTTAVQMWFGEELAHGAGCVEQVGRVLAANRDRRAGWVLRPLYRGLRHLAKRLPRDLNGFSSLRP